MDRFPILKRSSFYVLHINNYSKEIAPQSKKEKLKLIDLRL